MKFGIIKEGKIPVDERAPFSPKQCQEIKEKYPQIQIVVQKSDIRRFKNEEYELFGIELVDSVEDCDILLGVKEVPKEDLIANKIYFFFSHTIKQQPYNRELLKCLLAKNITMVDYECLTNTLGFRLIGFGRYAGIVGCYNTFFAYGKRTKTYELKRAYQCVDRTEMESELAKVKLPNNYKIVMTGDGRVANGALEIIYKLGLKRVTVQQFLNETFSEPVYVQLPCNDYNKRKDNQSFTLKEFFSDPTPFESTFMLYAQQADCYIACHYWHSKSPLIFTRNDAKSPQFRIKVIGDISCDINGPVASTLFASTIEEPLYGYNPFTEVETQFDDQDAITIMSVDNLPNELPRDSSEDFGREFIGKILPHLLNDDQEKIIERATICEKAKLTQYHEYLNEFVNTKSLSN
jgi:alanine dehydrogenase